MNQDAMQRTHQTVLTTVSFAVRPLETHRRRNCSETQDQGQVRPHPRRVPAEAKQVHGLGAQVRAAEADPGGLHVFRKDRQERRATSLGRIADSQQHSRRSMWAAWGIRRDDDG